MDEFLCVTVRSDPSESVETFNRRLIEFWSAMIRGWPEQYALVYAETTGFQTSGDRLSRQYLVARELSGWLPRELAAAEIAHEPVDELDTYSKFEATTPEWFQIPH